MHHVLSMQLTDTPVDVCEHAGPPHGHASAHMLVTSRPDLTTMQEEESGSCENLFTHE